MSTTKSTALLATVMAMAACVSPSEHRRVLGANQALKAEIASLTATQQQLSRENEQLRGDLDRVGKQAADADWIREQKQKLDKLLATYQEGGSGAIPGVEVIRTGEGVAFRVLGGVLFRPGSIEISDQGKQTLGQILTSLKQEGKRVRVDGHTDDTPIRQSQWGTNLRLSAERSLAVADFLVKSGLAADHVGIGGFGEYRPVEAAGTDAARQKNRRVEILMLDK